MDWKWVASVCGGLKPDSVFGRPTCLSVYVYFSNIFECVCCVHEHLCASQYPPRYGHVLWVGHLKGKYINTFAQGSFPICVLCLRTLSLVCQKHPTFLVQILAYRVACFTSILHSLPTPTEPDQMDWAHYKCNVAFSAGLEVQSRMKFLMFQLLAPVWSSLWTRCRSV